MRSSGHLLTTLRQFTSGMGRTQRVVRGKERGRCTSRLDSWTNAADGQSAVSSYRVSQNGGLNVRSGSVRNRQTDACWIVVTLDGRHVFTANFGSGTISSYGFTPTGRLRLQDGTAASLGMLSQPVDLALSSDSGYLYLLLRGTGAVASFAIGDRGGLKPLGVEKGALPVADGASGLAAY